LAKPGCGQKQPELLQQLYYACYKLTGFGKTMPHRQAYFCKQ